MEKILVIGQAPPAKQQAVPYDSTLLYNWLEEIGITQAQAGQMFEFLAMVDAFPGSAKNGHKKPKIKDMDRHFFREISPRLKDGTKVILLGSVAGEYFLKYVKSHCYKRLYLLHPSRRNLHKFRQNKTQILNDLKNFIYE